MKTYSHLAHLKRKPTDYEIGTTGLLWYPARGGFETEVPLAPWYRRYQAGSPLQCADWEAFADPRETTYTSYTSLQARREIFVDELLKTIDATGYDAKLPPEWLRTLAQVLPALRYPVHGLQMAAAYVGQMAPSGRIVVCALMQTADEIRRIQRLAYRLRQLQHTHAALGDNGRKVWETDPVWQPLREAVERLLVAWDWGEAFVALNFAVKPAFDELFMVAFGRVAHAAGDEALQKILLSLNEDCAWQRSWSQQLVRLAVAQRPENRAVMEAWLSRWRPLARASVRGFTRMFEPFGSATRGVAFADVAREIEQALDGHWQAAVGEAPAPQPTRKVA